MGPPFGGIVTQATMLRSIRQAIADWSEIQGEGGDFLRGLVACNLNPSAGAMLWTLRHFAALATSLSSKALFDVTMRLACACRGMLAATSLRDRIFESSGKCEWCHTNLLRKEFELDHIENLANGGSNTASNIVVSCPDCNRRKSARNVVSFALETLARTGIETPLIKRVLARHDVRGGVQLSLFGDDEAETAGRPLFTASDTENDDPPPDEVPPYRW